MANTFNKQSTWGYVRGTHISTLKIACPAGLPLALIAGAIRAHLNPSTLEPWLATALYAAFFYVPLTLLLWVTLVDRSTLPGAADKPQLSVESHWHTRAADTAFLATLTACGIGAFVATGTVSMTLAGVIAFAMLSYALAYMREKNR
ncbi:hypothetical protein QP315_00550 [Actinotignum timonense]|uniref:hypothetical protein n=1 Tax=Actinotignum timonense TaxID=1870995 RepID=UPI00254B1E47|nr:hypothetical protein [Actinotignum timonense]MDK6905716.1 hypothetical protein [Actinotignum timonense]